MSSPIQLSKAGELVKKHSLVTEGIEKLINKAVPTLGVQITLPNKLGSQTPNELFCRAAEFRAHLDTLCTLLSGIMVLRLQLKIAARLAARTYKEALTKVFALQKAEIMKAKGFVEKEMLAQAYIQDDVIVDNTFWIDTLSDVDDTIDVIKLKMDQFKGGLSTLLTQTSLAKTNGQFSGFSMGESQKTALEAAQAPAQTTEGETNFDA